MKSCTQDAHYEDMGKTALERVRSWSSMHQGIVCHPNSRSPAAPRPIKLSRVPPWVLRQEAGRVTYHKWGGGYIREEMHRDPLADKCSRSQSGKPRNAETGESGSGLRAVGKNKKSMLGWKPGLHVRMRARQALY